MLSYKIVAFKLIAGRNRSPNVFDRTCNVWSFYLSSEICMVTLPASLSTYLIVVLAKVHNQGKQLSRSLFCVHLLRRLHIVLLNAELYIFFYPILVVILWQGLKILHHYRQCFGYICVVKCRWINRVWDFIGALRLGNVFKEPAFDHQ